MLSSGGEGYKTETGNDDSQTDLILQEALFLIDERKQNLAGLLCPIVSPRHRQNVGQVALLGRPRNLHVVASDWPKALTAQPLLVAVVGQMHLHAYALVYSVS